jgi:L-ribulose-5-phosphate 3-epimerase UlaE
MERLPIGIYEKALPFNVDWPERLAKAKEVGFDFVEISIDESDERLSRLDWPAKQRAALRAAATANTRWAAPMRPPANGLSTLWRKRLILRWILVSG